MFDLIITALGIAVYLFIGVIVIGLHVPITRPDLWEETSADTEPVRSSLWLLAGFWLLWPCLLLAEVLIAIYKAARLRRHDANAGKSRLSVKANNDQQVNLIQRTQQDLR